MDLLEISGFRDTRVRVEDFDLKATLQGKTVLEIGCNTGFIALSIADAVKKIVGFELNPHLIAIAQDGADFLKCPNTEFLVSSFEDFTSTEKFDAVLSFANHSTHDGNTVQGLEDYFKKCWDLLPPGGIFLFESHPPEIEKNGFEKLCGIIEQFFQIHKLGTPPPSV